MKDLCARLLQISVCSFLLTGCSSFNHGLREVKLNEGDTLMVHINEKNYIIIDLSSESKSISIDGKLGENFQISRSLPKSFEKKKGPPLDVSFTDTDADGLPDIKILSYSDGSFEKFEVFEINHTIIKKKEFEVSLED